MIRLLLVEDDKMIAASLCDFLRLEGFFVEWASGQQSCFDCMEHADATGNGFDLVLLDISLSDGNGFVICSSLKRHQDIPIIFLTASGDEHSIITGLDMGADDYISKPFRPKELVSRIKSVLRRYGRTQSVFHIQNVTVDTDKGTVLKNGQDVNLSALEYRLLLVFFNHMGQVMTRTQLLEHIWDAAGDFVNDNTLTVYIKRLREKIEDDPSNPVIIKTVRGIGYKIGGTP